MGDYVRSDTPHVVYRDDDGKPIDYGRRWGSAAPPDEAYERTSNLARFEPIVTVAKSLIDWARTSYDADVAETPASPDGARSVRMTPSDPHSTPLVFEFTDFHGVIVTAGDGEPVPFPVCGCDACDDDVEAELDRLETLVFAVVNGDRKSAAWPLR